MAAIVLRIIAWAKSTSGITKLSPSALGSAASPPAGDHALFFAMTNFIGILLLIFRFLAQRVDTGQLTVRAVNQIQEVLVAGLGLKKGGRSDRGRTDSPGIMIIGSGDDEERKGQGDKSMLNATLCDINMGTQKNRGTGLGDGVWKCQSLDLFTQNCLSRLSTQIEACDGEVVNPRLGEWGSSTVDPVLKRAQRKGEIAEAAFEGFVAEVLVTQRF